MSHRNTLTEHKNFPKASFLVIYFWIAVRSVNCIRFQDFLQSYRNKILRKILFTTQVMHREHKNKSPTHHPRKRKTFLAINPKRRIAKTQGVDFFHPVRVCPNELGNVPSKFPSHYAVICPPEATTTPPTRITTFCLTKTHLE